MYDALTGRYGFSCPLRGGVRVRLSAFRTLDRLPGASHPVVYKVTFACDCGAEHDGLVAHDDLDWAPLAGSDVSFFNVMTSRYEALGQELLDRAVRQINAGDWPWTFFCYPEGRVRPTFPSQFRLLVPADDEIAMAVRCPSCARTSVNLVSRAHVDVPFANDARVAVVEHIFSSDALATLEAFRDELDSGSFGAGWRGLAA